MITNYGGNELQYPIEGITTFPDTAATTTLDHEFVSAEGGSDTSPNLTGTADQDGNYVS